MPAAQLVDDLRAGVVLQASQILQTKGPDRLDLVVVEVRAKHHVGENLQGRARDCAPASPPRVRCAASGRFPRD